MFCKCYWSLFQRYYKFKTVKILYLSSILNLHYEFQYCVICGNENVCSILTITCLHYTRRLADIIILYINFKLLGKNDKNVVNLLENLEYKTFAFRIMPKIAKRSFVSVT